jgi:hypothetical protein
VEKEEVHVFIEHHHEKMGHFAIKHG